MHGAKGDSLAHGPRIYIFFFFKLAVQRQGIFLKKLGYQNKSSWD
jgi:hypothetical protein